jgi:hypothetical protein
MDHEFKASPRYIAWPYRERKKIINKTKICFFEKIFKIHNLLLIWEDWNKSGMKGDIATGITEIKKDHRTIS